MKKKYFAIWLCSMIFCLSVFSNDSISSNVITNFSKMNVIETLPHDKSGGRLRDGAACSDNSECINTCEGGSCCSDTGNTCVPGIHCCGHPSGGCPSGGSCP